jgi:carboxyl-terminal processing protease
VPGDIITAINEAEANDLGYYGVMCELGTGGEDTSVAISVKKADGSVKELDIERHEVVSKNIRSSNLGSRTGLITVDGFAKGDADVFKNEMERLLRNGCEKFVLDLRNNAGGDIDEVAQMLDFLLGEGTLFTVSQKSGVTETRVSKHKTVPYPMAVVVNERTLCASEVFAGVLQLFDAAELVGTRTGGKATVQTLTELSDGTAVSLSTTKYIIGTGFDFDGTGLNPDVECELSVEDIMKFTTLSAKEDGQILAALEYLKDKEAVYSKD